MQKTIIYAPWQYPWMLDLLKYIPNSELLTTGTFQSDWHTENRLRSVTLAGEVISWPVVKADYLIIFGIESIGSQFLYMRYHNKIPTLLVAERHYGVPNKAKKQVMQYIFNSSKVVLAESQAAARYLTANYKCANIRIVMHGVDIHKFEPVIPCSDTTKYNNTILYLGGFNENKGWPQVLEAIKKLPDKLFVVVSNTTIPDKPNNMLRVERVPPEEMSDIYSFASIVLHPPTKIANSDNVLLEAMACGKAIITTDVGGNRDIVGDCGDYVEAGGDLVVSIVERIKTMTSLKISVLGQLARRRAVEELSMEKYASTLLELKDSVR